MPSTATAQRTIALEQPRNDAPVDGAAALFRWDQDGPQADYRLQVALDEHFDDVVFDTEVGRRNRVTLFELLPQDGTRLFWRVQELDQKTWSEVASFRGTTDDEAALSDEDGDDETTAYTPQAPITGKEPETKATEVPTPTEPLPYVNGTTGKAEAMTFTLFLVVSFSLVMLAILIVG